MQHKTIHLKDTYGFLGENGKDATLDIYLPFNMDETNRQNDKRPCMVVCPGGGYAFCSQREAEPIALNFLPYGFNCFVLTYSCAPHKFPSQLLEVAAVMDLIHNNADKWNCDTSKVAIIGFSAGGHLACHYSNCYDCKEVREYFPNSYPVSASVLAYPVISAEPDFGHIGSFNNLLGKTDITKEDIEKFSLEKRVNEHTPPAFIWHTAEDTCVPVRNSLEYAKALSKYNILYELHIYPFGWHGLSTADAQTNGKLEEKLKIVHSWISEANSWLKIIFDL